MSGESGTGVINAVTEGRVTVTANDSEANIRTAMEFEPKEADGIQRSGTVVEGAELDEVPADASKPAVVGDDRNADGTFKAKQPVKDDKGGDPRKSVQAKINEERRLRGEADRRAVEAERKAADLEAKLAAGAKPAAPVETQPSTDATSAPTKPPTHLELIRKYQADAAWPKLDDFMEFQDPYAAMLAAQAAYIGESQQAERDQRESQRQGQERTRSVVRDVFEEAEAKFTDWQDLMATPAAALDLTDVALNEIYADPTLSADIWHHLLTHPDEMAALTTVRDPIAAARLVARIPVNGAAAHSGPAAVPRQTKAKPLIKPVGASPAAPEASPPDALPFGKSYIEAMNAQERKQRGSSSGA